MAVDRESGSLWSSAQATERWQAGAARRQRYLGPATERLLALLDLRPGQRVLDLAAGTGDTSVAAARLVGPSGYVLVTDISAAMLTAAAETATRDGLGQLHTLAVDAAQLDVPAHSFDAAICRLGLMYVPDLDRTLRLARAALRSGSRLVALTWSSVDRNPYFKLPLDAASALRVLEGQHEPLLVRACSLGTSAVLTEAFETAGFQAVGVEAVAIERRFETLPEAMDTMLTTSAAADELTKPLSDAQRRALWQSVERALGGYRSPDGGYVVPGEALLTVGTA